MGKTPYVILGLTVLMAAQTTSARTAVETFTATVSYAAPSPGQALGSGVLFNGNMTLNSVDFTPGLVTFRKQRVDFDGTESSWLSSVFTGTASIPVNSGPATVAAGSGGGVSGAATCAARGSVSNVVLGPAFSASNLDIVNGTVMGVHETCYNWQSAVVPQLNATIVEVEGTDTVTSVDAANRIITTSSVGTIFASVTPVPALSPFGIVLLVIGLLGALFLTLHKRRIGGLRPA